MSERLLFPPVQPKPSLGEKKRKRATNACLRCRLKKQRCDGLSQPCGNCAKSSSECVFPDEIMGEKFLRQHIANLEARVRELSFALKEVDPSHSVLKATDAELLSEQDLVDGFGFLSLTSGAEPLYVGGSSGASWGRIFSSALCNQTGEAHFFAESLIPPKTSLYSLSPDECRGAKSSSLHGSTAPSDSSSTIFQPNFAMQVKSGFIFPPLPQDDHLSDEIFATVFTTIQARHCFMDFVVLKKWYNEREKYCSPDQPLVADASRTAAFFLWLTYALGLRLWEMRGRVIPGLPSHEYYFQAALQYYDHVSSNTTTIQALLFLSMYSFRSTKGLSTWHLTGLAMRTALELGLHRKTPKAQQISPSTEEAKRRIWWSVYALERTIAFQLGRPIAIQDDEIDNELPLDIDCHIMDDEQILARRSAIDKKLSETGTNLENNPYPLGWTTMSPSLHHIRLRMILTKIKAKVYHPRFSRENMEQRHANVESLASELDRWRAHIPAKNVTTGNADDVFGLKSSTQNEFQPQAESGWDSGGIPFYTGEWFELQYYNALQSLLIPCALTAPPGSLYLHRAAHAAMNACELQRKRLREDNMSPLAVYSLHKLFMSGVFLLWALGKDPSLSVTSNDVGTDLGSENPGLRDYGDSSEKHSASLNGISIRIFLPVKHCQEALSIYATHYPQAKPYAHCFENMSNIWLRRVDRRDNCRELAVQQHRSPERIPEAAPETNTTHTQQPMEASFNPSHPPTLWKDDLNLPSRVRPSFFSDANLQLQSGPPLYHLLSLGPVEPTCEPLQLLKSEVERYQSQKPWMLGCIQRECPNDLLRNTFPPPGPSSTKSLSSYHSEIDNPAATPTDSVGSLKPRSAVGPEGQFVYQLQDYQAKLSDCSSWNDASSDQNLNNSSGSYSPGPRREVQRLGPGRNYRIDSRRSLSYNDEENATKVPEEANGNLRKMSFMSQQTCFEEITSSGDPNVDSLPNLLASQQRRMTNFTGGSFPSSVTPGAGLPPELYDASQRNECSSNNWLEENLQFAGNTAALSSVGGQVQDGDFFNNESKEGQSRENEYASSVSSILGEKSVPSKGLVPTNTGSAIEASGHQDLQNCIELLLAGQRDQDEPANKQYVVDMPRQLMSTDRGSFGEMMETGLGEMFEGSDSNDRSAYQGSVNFYNYHLR
ncbi:hypothetical protein Pst134EA_025643 [Puccinia striiformis f. sp. tritici]|uniref:hypothetical protein n=1 Tax=Puccinia striiformis f. sp. tritici TaxID=168172 RepID=UPI002008516D|nr:hypothetical protein Pst134EA_025643 [Puccinia striiformis f. sp. tritici]KAH9451699.1 hypothetical protein Pst134EA_025643 [Puccinia striiformis f. sp. tritici]